MSNTIAIDIISDLHLTSTDEFDWTEKPTSLFCVVAGGISSNIEVIESVLEHLSKIYRGVLYIDGVLEHADPVFAPMLVSEVKKICDKHTNLVYLHNHVIVLNGVAFVGCNGWRIEDPSQYTIDQRELMDSYRIEDIGYLTNTIKNLQIHKDAKKVVVVSGSVPAEEFLYKHPGEIIDKIDPLLSLITDTEKKVGTWIYGGSNIEVDVTYNNRRFLNNPCYSKSPYWAKRIEL